MSNRRVPRFPKTTSAVRRALVGPALALAGLAVGCGRASEERQAAQAQAQAPAAPGAPAEQAPPAVPPTSELAPGPAGTGEHAAEGLALQGSGSPAPAAPSSRGPAAAAPRKPSSSPRPPSASADKGARAGGGAAPARVKAGEADEAVPGSALARARAAFEREMTGCGPADPLCDGEPLSCGGAKPHLDAICMLADRLCGAGGAKPTTPEAQRECAAARDACTRGRARFEAACEHP